MKRLIDLTGKKFGRWTVIRRNYPNCRGGTKGEAMWLCKCNCSKEGIVRGSNLRGGISKSCGCLRRDKRKLRLGLASMRDTISNYKKNARIRGLEYDLTEEQFKEITQKDCYYCGAKPNNIHRKRNGNGNYIYNGLDRIDNNKGYIIDNVVPCCKICNRAKSTLTLQEFKDWIKRIYKKIIK